MFCPGCGKELAADANFCPACGMRSTEQSFSEAAGSRIAAASLTPHRRRPIWIWAIFLFYLVSTVWTLLSFFLIYSGRIRINAAQQAYLANISVVEVLASVGLGLLSLTAAVFLFALQRGAVTLFAIALVVNIAYTVLHALTTNWAEAIGGPGLLGVLLSWGLLLAILTYSRRLARDGVLL